MVRSILAAAELGWGAARPAESPSADCPSAAFPPVVSPAAVPAELLPGSGVELADAEGDGLELGEDGPPPGAVVLGLVLGVGGGLVKLRLGFVVGGQEELDELPG